MAQGYCEVYCDFWAKCTEEPENCQWKNEVNLYNRLREYEATGLEPEEVAVLKASLDAAIAGQETLQKHFAKDAEAERQSRGTGCEWCNSIGKRLEDFAIGDLMARSVAEHTYWGAGDWHQQRIRFCPICGKELEGGDDA